MLFSMYLWEMTTNSRILCSMETSSKKKDKVETNLKNFTTRKNIKEIRKCLAVRMKKKFQMNDHRPGEEMKWKATTTKNNSYIRQHYSMCRHIYVKRKEGKRDKKDGKGGKLKYSTQLPYNPGIGREIELKCYKFLTLSWRKTKKSSNILFS